MMIVEKGGASVSWYDIATGIRQHKIGLPEMPHEFAVDADNRYAYVGHYGVPNSKTPGDNGRSVFVVDIRLGAIVHTFILGEHARPHGIALDENGRLFVLSEQTNHLLIYNDPRDFGDVDYIRPVGGEKAHLFALRRDGRRAYCVNLGSSDVTVIDPFDPDSRPVSIKTGSRPEGRWLREDQKVLFVTNRGDDTISVIDAITLGILETLPTPHDPMRVMHDSKRNQIITINNHGYSVSFFDGITGKEIYRHEVAGRPIAMCTDENQDYLFVAHRMDQVLRLSLDTFQQDISFTTEPLPDVMHILPQNLNGRWSMAC